MALIDHQQTKMIDTCMWLLSFDEDDRVVFKPAP